MIVFKTEPVTKSITRITAPAGEKMYLIEGTERAVLIDTGRGFGKLKDAVAGLTQKPLTVLLSHGHVDHAMGAAEFEDVRMNLEDAYIYEKHQKMDFRMSEWREFPCASQAEPDEIMPAAPLAHFRDLKEGMHFDLGGITIETYACPGHTKGSLVFLIPEEEILFTGDACNSLTFLYQDYSTSVSVYQKSLARLLPMVKGRYARILLSHGSGDAPADLVEELLHLCGEILSGTDDKIPVVMHGDAGMLAKEMDAKTRARKDGGTGNIIYHPKKILGS